LTKPDFFFQFCIVLTALSYISWVLDLFELIESYLFFEPNLLYLVFVDEAPPILSLFGSLYWKP